MLSYLFNVSSTSWHQKLYIYSIYLSYLLFAVAYTGVIIVSPDYLQSLNTFIKYYVSLFLVIRFNPFIDHSLHNNKTASFDRRIAFSAGLFLLLTTTAIQIAKTQLENIVDELIFSGGVKKSDSPSF